MTAFLPAAGAGLGLGLSLIIAIGAQNAFILRQGIRREHVVPIVLICALSDAALILLSIGGLGVIIDQVPGVLTPVRWAGAAFLVAYGLLAARRACTPGTLVGDPSGRSLPLGAAVLTCLALTWLNPHLYIDIIVVGSVANTYDDPGRWFFGAGAVIASILWFCVLGFGARLLAGVFGRPLAWRLLDAGIAVIMLVIAVSLVV